MYIATLAMYMQLPERVEISSMLKWNSSDTVISTPFTTIFSQYEITSSQ